MSRRRHNTTDLSHKTQPTNQEENIDYDQTDGSMSQFEKVQRKFPWKTVLFIIFFLIAGASCLVCSILVSTGSIGKKYDDRAWPLLLLGILMFIPGGYYSYILICICVRREGFTVEDIPML